MVHVINGVFVDAGGYELVAALGAGALVLPATGAGRLSVDHVLSRARTAGTARGVRGATSAREAADARA
jgi:putative oxidoreductase